MTIEKFFVVSMCVFFFQILGNCFTITTDRWFSLYIIRCDTVAPIVYFFSLHRSVVVCVCVSKKWKHAPFHETLIRIPLTCFTLAVYFWPTLTIARTLYSHPVAHKPNNKQIIYIYMYMLISIFSVFFAIKMCTLFIFSIFFLLSFDCYLVFLLRFYFRRCFPILNWWF